VELPAHLAEAVRKISGCHFVHASSGLVYENRDRPAREDDPIGTHHPYGASKVEAEERLRELAVDGQFPLTIVRPFSFTGLGDFGTRLFPSLLRSAIEGVPFQMSAGEQVRDHSSVNDIARGIVAAALQGNAETTEPQIFNLGSGDTRALRDLVSDVVQQLDLDVNIQFGARPPSRTEPMFSVSDSTRAKEQLGWRPRESVAQAVWQLTQTSFPTLKVKEPTGST
jgi:CDP-glucose 4,6-dehydratase